MWYYVYFLGLLVSAVLTTIVAIYAWRNQKVHGATVFAWLMSFVGGWLWSHIMILTSPSFALARFWSKMQLTNIIAVSIAWLAFVIVYIGNQTWLTSRFLILLSSVPAMSILLVWTNEKHHLFLKHLDFYRVDDFLLIPDRTYGAWFLYVHSVYSYAAIMIGVALLVRQVMRSFRIYRLQTISLLIGAVAPLVPNVIATFVWPQLPLTFVGFVITSITYGFAIFRYHLFDLAPIARDTLIDSMVDGMLVLDKQNRIVDLNPAMQSMLNLEIDTIIGQTAETILQHQPGLLELILGTVSRKPEIVIQRNGALCHYSIKISPLTNRRGQLIVARDITELRQTEEALRKRSTELEISNAEMEAFAHTVAHSLRNPLFALIRFGKFLEANLEQMPVEKIGQNVRDIIQTGAQMGNIVEELLDLLSRSF